MFARAVDENELIQKALENVVFIHIDCEKGEGVEIAKKYNVRGYPTFLMTNADGDVTDGLIGYPGPEKWSSFVHAGNKDRRTIADKQAAFEKTPDKALACALANHASTAYDFAASVKYLRAARQLDPTGTAEYTGNILTSMYYGSRSESFTLDEVEAEAKLVLDSSDSSADNIVDAARLMRTLAGPVDQMDRAVPYLKAALAASDGVEDLANARTELEIDGALFIDKDMDKAVALKRATFTEGWQDNPGDLNNFAWWCFENNVNLAEAEELILHGVDLATDDRERSNLLDTAAEICNARGDCSEAIARIKKAIELSPDRQYYKDQLARFEKELADKKG